MCLHALRGQLKYQSGEPYSPVLSIISAMNRTMNENNVYIPIIRSKSHFIEFHFPSFRRLHAPFFSYNHREITLERGKIDIRGG